MHVYDHALLEYASPAFHNSLPKYLNAKIENVPKRCLKRIFPELSYDEAFGTSELKRLQDRRSATCSKLFSQALKVVINYIIS
jgi:hypothetical protein